MNIDEYCIRPIRLSSRLGVMAPKKKSVCGGGIGDVDPEDYYTEADLVEFRSARG